MPSIDVIDTIEIDAEPSLVFEVVADYAGISTWLPIYRCELLDAQVLEVGTTVRHRYGYPPFIISDFTRRVDSIDPGRGLQESYIDGNLRGTGTWRFEAKGNLTRASYHCKVNSHSLGTHISFMLFGNQAHSGVYKPLLSALKQHCENLPAH